MKIGITSKLFLAIVLSCALVAIAVSAAMRYNFQQGFLGYLNEQEAQRLETLRPTLANAYREHGNWDFLRGNPRLWFGLLRQHAGQDDARVQETDMRRDADSADKELLTSRQGATNATQTATDAATNAEASPETQANPQSPVITSTTAASAQQAASQAPAAAQQESGRRAQGNQREQRESSLRPPRGPRPPATESDLTGLQLRISLLDDQRQLVIGNPRLRDDASFRPIEVNGSTVGWITLVPFQQVSTGAALRFQQQQVKTSWIIGGLAIALSALVAWLLAQTVIAPLKRIAASTHRLAAGDYKTRVTVSSSDELAQLASDFNHLALTLEKNEQLRRAFMADVSHELRTPLSVLKGELEALEDGVRTMSMTSVASLQAEVGILGKLVDDLYELSLSDVGALTYRKQPVDVIEALRTTLAAFADKLSGKSIRLVMRIAPDQRAEIDADPDRLRQLFNNLLENAVRYTDPGGCLQIDCSIGAGKITLDFQDSKPGVSETALPQLFERFYRVEGSRNRATGGAGLGLAISRNIVDAHQGSIIAKHSALGGVWIAVTLPLTGAAT